MYRGIVILITTVLLSACVSDPLMTTSVNNITVAQAAAEPALVKGQRVRWGGTIINTRNQPDASIVEVLARPLDFDKPNDRRAGLGRFKVRIPGFVDPAEYQSPNRLTVVGTLVGLSRGKVGDFTYDYPVVNAEIYHLWLGKTPTPVYEPYPYWWDDPFYPHWRGYPYWW